MKLVKDWGGFYLPAVECIPLLMNVSEAPGSFASTATIFLLCEPHRLIGDPRKEWGDEDSSTFAVLGKTYRFANVSFYGLGRSRRTAFPKANHPTGSGGLLF